MLSDDASETSARSGKLSDTEQRAMDIAEHEEDIIYSARYSDDTHEYRHVNVPREIGRLMTENEWRGLGIKQSPGWYHYMLHAPEPHILLFKRDL
ncbi:hypothetical protein HDU98_001351 [Podochytrium sp. JEL0797]|nr:hypothetical protein HDU98_001351 [Podochytrium sp. JEL0797]